jgi:SAM-dependent methyltransferase
MKPAFASRLRCPQCRGPLTAAGAASDEGEIASGSLTCPKDHRVPIVRGIPRFVPGEGYAQSFGYEWNLHRRTQLDSSQSHESEETFKQKTGLRPEDLRGKLVLDVGCGMGRFADVASRWGATVVGIDLSSAVEAASDNLGGRSNVHLAQADVFALPFAEGSFDIIYSIGVLHHTPDTRAAFLRLPPLLKAGGTIAIWVYSSHRPWRFWSSDILRVATTRLPKTWLYRLCHVAVPLYYVCRIPIAGNVVRGLLPISVHPKPDWRILDTFDWYSPSYQWKHSRAEVAGWFETAGLRNVQLLEVPTSAQGTR